MLQICSVDPLLSRHLAQTSPPYHYNSRSSLPTIEWIAMIVQRFIANRAAHPPTLKWIGRNTHEDPLLWLSLVHSIVEKKKVTVCSVLPHPNLTQPPALPSHDQILEKN